MALNSCTSMAAKPGSMVGWHAYSPTHRWCIAFMDYIRSMGLSYASFCGVERALGKRTDRFINVSDSERQACLALGLLNRERSLVVNNGIDWQSFDALTVDVRQVKAGSGLTPAMSSSAISRNSMFRKRKMISPQPSHSCLRDVQQRNLFVGDGTLRPQIEDQVARLGVDRQVVFTGYRDDVASLLKAIDVIASRRAGRGSPSSS